MEANKRKEIGWILLWIVGTVFLFGSAGCKKKSAQTGQSGFPTSTTGQTTFTSPDDAATKTFGSLSVASDNIITARASQSEMITGRMITGRMITGRMITGRVITARIITGRIITARSPKFLNVSGSDNDDNEDDILNLFGRLKKSRLSKKQSEEFEISCEDLKPKCVEGKVEKADCNQSTNRLNFDIKVSECKEIVDEQEGDYIVSTGYVKGYLEISTKVSRNISEKVSQNISDAKFIVAIEDGDSLVKEFIGNKETKRVKAKSSKFRTEITGRFIEGEKDVDFRVETKLSGAYSREDEIGNRKEAYSYNDYVVELTGKSPKSEGEPTFYVGIAGGYSVDTEPASCVEGTFNFKTIKPIKSSGQGYCGAESGEIEVNNAKTEFSSGKVKVSVDNQQKEYGCEELGGLCKYEPITIAEGVEQKPCPVWFKDADGDGYTDGVTKVSCEQPDGYVSQAQTGDCDDNDKNINPNTVWFKDKDKDGYTDGTTKVSCAKPSDEYVSSATAGDCDDNDTNINPVRAEICDGLDNNCNGTIDDGVLLVFYKDLDGDGYTDGATQVGCSASQGYVLSATSGDCNDSDSSMNSGRTEICDSKDNNCNGQIDEGVLLVFYRDQDGDGYGYANNSTQACSQPAGYVSNSSDCNDNNANLHPNTIWFKDADFDGFYPAGGSSVSCNNPFAPNNATYVAIPGGDCNDTNASIYPGAPLNCNNGQDNDCSGNVEKWAYTDVDGDRYAPNSTSSCVDVVNFPGKITAGQQLGTNDCNDNNASIYPGAPLNCSNGQDNDCSGNVEKWAYTDVDGDRYAPNSTSSCVDVVNFPGKITAGQQLGTNDCNDTSSSIYPGAPLNCNNGQDNDCSGNVEKWAYTDQDGDLYAPNNVSSCVDFISFPEQITAGQELGTNDCNDTNVSIYPGAPLNCSNGQDNDCSGNVEKWAYTDVDGDRYAPNSTSSCVDVVSFPGQITAGSELGTNDCNDSNSSINPSAPDNTCDSIDNNCNLYVDENTAPCFVPSSVGIYSWGLTYVSLSWSYPSPSSNVEKFVIQRSPNGITYVDVAEAPASATNYTIRTYLTSKYYFRVYAKNATGSGSPSSVTSAPIGVNSLFEKTIGGSSDDVANSIIQSSDGGYVVAGGTYSFGAGYSDMYVVKLDSGGNVQWTKTIGGSGYDEVRSIIQSSDGGYVVAGGTYSFGAGYSDMYVVKLDSGGNVQWTKTIGGSGYDEVRSIIQSSDGGYAVAGWTTSFGSYYDFYVVKLDSGGNVQWTKTIGGSNDDFAPSIMQSSDGGYAVAGYTYSFGAGTYDFYVVKLDSGGNVQWTKTIGGSNDDFAYSITQSSDGGYAVAGYTQSFGAGGRDFYVVKLDSGGNVQWTKTIGGSSDDEAWSIIQSSDGGYVVAGGTTSFGAGGWDIYVVKLDSGGNVQWTKTIGGSNDDFAPSIMQSSDGGYTVAGHTNSFGAGSYDMYVVKIGSDGTLGCHDSFQSPTASSGVTETFQTPSSSYVSPLSSFVSPVSYSLATTDIALCMLTFAERIGGSNNDFANSIIQSSDGGYVVAGYTNSFGGSYDFYVVKLYSSGSVAWTKTIGGSGDDQANSVVQSSDGSYVVAGYTTSFGAGGADMYVVKLGSGGNVQWTKTIGGSDDDFANSVIQSSDGGYVIAGYTQSFGAGGYDMYVVKLDSNGNVVWTKTIGGSNSDVANSIVQSSDGSYVVAGETLSFGASGRDIYVVKLDSSGNIVWTKTIGGSWDDFANSVIQSSDGGYVIAGYTQSFGASWYDIYVVKLDSSGNVIWSKTIGGGDADVAYSIIQSSDGGYIVIGRTQSFGAGGYDVYVVKIDSSGNVLWTKTIGGGYADEARSITQSSDGGFAIAGYTQSFGAGSYDIYVVKTGPLGDTCWSQGITNYVVSSVSSSFSSPSTDAFPQSPTVTVVSPASGSGGSVSSVCFSAGAPPVPMCLISGGCDYYQVGSDMQKIAGTMKGVEREREQNEIKSYGCSAGGVLSRFLIPASILFIIYSRFRFRKKRKV
jgi:uncharacterized delta-60 repeat protein